MDGKSENPLDLVRSQRVARWATVDESGQPLVVPICYAFDDQFFFTVIDEKPKRKAAGQLKRVRNIQSNPRVSVVIDQYSEDWSRLAYVIVQGWAEVFFEGPEQSRGVQLLREKYPQYRAMKLEDQPVIRITPEKWISWQAQTNQPQSQSEETP